MAQMDFGRNTGGNAEAKRGMSLLDLIAVQMNCMYLSELQYLSREEREHLAEKLKKIPAAAEDLRQWNDALQYLTGEREPKQTAQEAQAALVAGLTAPEWTRRGVWRTENSKKNGRKLCYRAFDIRTMKG